MRLTRRVKSCKIGRLSKRRQRSVCVCLDGGKRRFEIDVYVRPPVMIVGATRGKQAVTTIASHAWSEMLSFVRREHGGIARGWFDALRPIEISGGVVRIQAMNKAQVDYLERSARNAFVQAAQAVTGRLVAVSFELAEELEQDQQTAEAICSFGDSGLPADPNCSFESLVAGPCNRLAVAAAQAVADNPGGAYNPLYVYGPDGTGKTHTLHAIAGAVRANLPGLRTVLLTGEAFTNQFMQAEEGGLGLDFRRRLEQTDVLILDDIQHLAGRTRSQEAFFHLFNALHQAQRQVVVSASAPPAEIDGLEARLRTRFESGLVASVEHPCLETRLAILRKKGQMRCLDLSEDAAQALAEQLEQTGFDWDRVLKDAESQGALRPDQRVTGPLREPPGAPTNGAFGLPAIVGVVSRRFQVDPDALCGRQRAPSLAHPRHVALYLAHALTDQKPDEIGSYFGGRNEVAVQRAIRSISDRAALDPQLRVLLDELANQVKNGDS